MLQLDPTSTVTLWHLFIAHHKHAPIAPIPAFQQIQCFSTSGFGIPSANEPTRIFLQSEVTQLFGTFIQVFDV